MEALIIIPIIIVLFLIINTIMLSSLRSDVQQKFDLLNKNFAAVHKQVKEYREQLVVQPKAKEAKMESSLDDVPIKDNALEMSFQFPIAAVPEIKTVRPKEAEPIKVEEKIKEKAEIKPHVEAPKIDAAVAPLAAGTDEKTKVAATAFHGHSSPTGKKEVSDMEKIIGENWLNKIGIAILVIGIGFFVKYAIDREWIGEGGRLTIGIATAFVLIGIAHWLRKSYHAFSSVLVGGGIATLYYTISIGYHDYSFFTQPEAFVIMTVITLMATGLALFYDRRELAIIGLIGGFTSPFMILGETNNPAAFFTYIAILNSGMLLLSFFKKWLVLNRLAFVLTSVYLTTWILLTGHENTTDVNVSITFLILFFVQFMAMNIVCNVFKKSVFSAWEFIHLFSITGLFYGFMMYTLEYSNRWEASGLFTGIMALFFMVLVIAMKKIPDTDKNLVQLLIGKTVTFLTLAVSLQFDGHYTTLFWAFESLVLLWLAQRSSLPLLRQASAIVLTVATAALCYDWIELYWLRNNNLQVVFNPAVATSFFVLLTFVATIFMLRRENDEARFFGYKAVHYKAILNGLVVFLLYGALLLELHHQLNNHFYDLKETLFLWMFHFIFILAGSFISDLRKKTTWRMLFFVLGTTLLILYILLGNYNAIDIRNDAIDHPGMLPFYYTHFVNAGLFVLLLVAMRRISRSIFDEQNSVDLYLILLSLFGIFIVSAELDMIVVHALADHPLKVYDVLHHTQVAGYTILWGIYSFGLMIYGMRKKLRAIRIFSLVAFSATLIKLFAFDIRNISEGGKIAAFISLGVMLLVISFLYQKLKKLVVEG